MEVNKLESREVLIMLFGLPTMITLIVLASIGVGHLVTTHSDRPTNVTVSAPSPKVDVNVPQSAAPNVHVSAMPPKVDVNVPQQPPPTVNVSTPPAVVTVLDRRAEPDSRSATTEDRSRSAAPADVRKAVVLPPAPPTPPAEVIKPELVKPPVEAPKVVPVKTEPGKSSSSNGEGFRPAVQLAEEELTLDTLYKYAERYIESYCAKNSLNNVEEARRWNSKWRKAVDQAIADNTDYDEQTFINRVAITKRECFDIEKATPEKIVEGCRILLRYRDGKLALMKAMRDAVTNENLKKTLVFLAAGVH